MRATFNVLNLYKKICLDGICVYLENSFYTEMYF